MRLISVLGATATLTLIAAACGSDAGSTASTAAADVTTTVATAQTASAPAGDCVLDEPVKFGYAADFDLGGIGDVPGSNGAGYIIDLQNAAGGIGGQQIEYEIKQISQTPPDPAAAQRAVQELIDGGVDVIFGPPFADYGLPLLEVTNGAVPVLFSNSTEVVHSDPARGAFLVSFDDRVQASAGAEFATEKGFSSAVTLSSSDIPYLNITTGAFTEVFTGAGGTVAKDLSFNLGDTDFSAQVNEIAAMDPQPDVIFSAVFLPEAGVFLKQLREAGVTSTFIGTDGLDASEVWNIGADAEGIFFSSHTFPGPGNRVQEFLDGYKAAKGESVGTISFGALGADTAQIAIAAVEAACSTKGADIIAAMAGLTVETTTGTTSYVAGSGTPKRDVSILTVTDGAPALVKAFYPSVIAKG